MSNQDVPATDYSAAAALAADVIAAAEAAAQDLADSLDATVPAGLEEQQLNRLAATAARHVVDLVAAASRELAVAVHATAAVDAAAAVAAENARQTEAMLTHELLHDSLTGLPNQRLLADRLTQALARSKRAGTSVAVLFLDLDGFKNVNDTFGHAAGDQLLIAVANRLRQCLRETDTCARMGGDEFVLVLEDMSRPSDGSRLAGRVKTALAEGVALGGHTMQVRASVGLAVSSDGSDPATLLHEADTAMYRAKQGDQALDRRQAEGSDGDVPNTSLTEDDSGPGVPLHARRRTD